MAEKVPNPTDLKGINKAGSAHFSPVTTVVSEIVGKQKAQVKYVKERKVARLMTLTTLLISFCMLVGYGFLARYVDKITPTGSPVPWTFYACFYSALALAIISTVAIVVALIQILLHNLATSDFESTKSNKFYWFVLLNKFKFSIGIIGSLILFPFLTHRLTKFTELLVAFRTRNNGKSSYKEPDYYNWVFLRVIEYYDTAISKILVITTILVLKSALLFTLEYNIRNKVYFKKNALNEVKLDLLKRLNELVNATDESTVGEVVDKIIMKIGRDDRYIYYTETMRAIGETDAERLFAFADPTGDYKISQVELTSFYKKSFTEHEALRDTRTQTDSSIGSLNGALTFLCILIIGGILVTDAATFRSNSVAYFTTIVSGSYIFSDIIKKFLLALAFVFFIRSFEVGDVVELSGKLYVVKQINLLATTFEKGNLVVNMSNDKLYEAETTNYTLSESMEQKYSFRFNSDDFKKKSHEFIKKLKHYADSHRSTFTSRPYFNDLEIVDADSIRVSLVADYQLKYQELAVVDKRKNSFLLHVQDTMKAVDLVCK